jgi:AbiTii
VNNRSRCPCSRTSRPEQLDQKTPIGDLLRKVIALGGQAASKELRDWATKELRGYQGDEQLPPYRIIGAPLQLDMINLAYTMRGQTISPLELPKDFTARSPTTWSFAGALRKSQHTRGFFAQTLRIRGEA